MHTCIYVGQQRRNQVCECVCACGDCVWPFDKNPCMDCSPLTLCSLFQIIAAVKMLHCTALRDSQVPYVSYGDIYCPSVLHPSGHFYFKLTFFVENSQNKNFLLLGKTSLKLYFKRFCVFPLIVHFSNLNTTVCYYFKEVCQYVLNTVYVAGENIWKILIHPHFSNESLNALVNFHKILFFCLDSKST